MFSTLVIMYQIIPLLQIFIPLLQENVTCYSKTEYRFGISTFDLIKITISGRCFFPKLKFVAQCYLGVVRLFQVSILLYEFL